MSKIVYGGILLLTLTTAVLCPLGLKEMQARAAGVDTCAAAIAVATNRWKDAATKGIPALDNQVLTFPQCLQRLGTELILGLPAAVVSSPSVLDALNKLSEPSCDHQAMLNLGDALRNAGYKNEALSVAMIYGVSCPGYRSFNVASGSMKPSLLLGDYLLV